jgi:hypothetical protein
MRSSAPDLDLLAIAEMRRRPALGSRLLPNLWIGPMPASTAHVARAGFQALVFCASELQPPAHLLGDGIRCIHCPLDDNDSVRLPYEQWSRAVVVSKEVAELVRSGSPVLVTCAQGRNRSGLVCALALHLLQGWRGRDAIRYVQSRRQGALSNADFRQQIMARLG